MFSQSDFVHLNVHSVYSMLNSQCKIIPLIKKARQLEMPALALTDDSRLFGLKHFHEECLSRNEAIYGDLPPIKPILGCTLKVDGFDLRLHAKNLTGYRNLMHLVSKPSIKGALGHPITFKMLAKHSEGLHCSSGGLRGEVATELLLGGIEAAAKVVKRYKSLFDDDYSLEVMLERCEITDALYSRVNGRVYDCQRLVMRGVFELGKKFNVRVIATNDVRFLNKDDFEAYEVLTCLAQNKTYTDPTRILHTGQEWFKSSDEMQTTFGEHPDILKNTREVVDRVETYNLDLSPPHTVSTTTQPKDQTHMAHIPTFGYMMPKSTIRDVARALNYPIAEAIRLADLIPNETHMTFERALKESAELKKAVEDATNPQTYRLLQIAIKLEGCIRMMGIQPCKYAVAETPITDLIPTMRLKGMKLQALQYEGRFLESLGLAERTI